MTITTTAPATATLEYLDPNQLTLGVNIRHDEKLHQQFLDSIRDRGVLEPVIAHREEQLIVVDQGQRRTLAAAQAGLPLIPVLIHDTAPDDESRLVDQWTENEHRAALSNSERVDAVQQLALIGLDVDQIAKRLHAPANEVAAAVKIANAPTAIEYIDGLTLDQAAVLAEFDDDREVLEDLTRRAQAGQGLEHFAERHRQERARAAKKAEIVAEMEAAGVTVVAAPNWDDKSIKELSELLTKGKKFRNDRHAACPGHVGWVRSYGEPEPIYGCRNWAKNGHTDRHGGSGKVAAADQTDEERAQASKERRHVIDSNKAWKAATTVRRRWLTEFAARTAPPSGAEQLIARATIEGWTAHITSYNPSGNPLSILDATKDSMAAALSRAGAKRALQLALATVLACWEASTSDDTWRSEMSSRDRAVLVLTTISQWGYELADIEQAIIDGTAAAVQ